MKKLVILSCLLLLIGVAHGQGQLSPRDQMIARAKKGMQAWRQGSKIWTARAKQVPDYGFEADAWNYDGDSWEGSFFVQYPDRYLLKWDHNSQVYADGGKVAVFNGGSKIEDLELTETPFWLLTSGEIGQTARVAAVSEEDVRLKGKVQKLLLVDLEPAVNPAPYKALRLYFPATGEPTLLGFRVPTQARSSWDPQFANFWLTDFHPELADEAIFKAPAGE